MCLRVASRLSLSLIINVGSSSEYGASDKPMSENDTLKPNRVYGVAKVAQTHLANLFASTTQTAMTTFRLFSVYGPWDDPTKVIPTLISYARRRQPVPFSAPAVARDFVYVDDVVDAVLAFDKLSSHRGGIFNIGTGTQTTLLDLVTIASEFYDREVKVCWSQQMSNAWDATCWRADITKTRTALGWQASHQIRDGFALTARWMEEYQHDLSHR